MNKQGKRVTNKTTQIRVFADSSELIPAVAHHIGDCAHSAVAARGTFRIGLSGGSTPLGLYAWLAKGKLPDFPWKRCEAWLVDERFVPPDHPDHNGATIANILCEPIGLLPHAALNGVDTSTSKLWPVAASGEPFGQGPEGRFLAANSAATQYEAKLDNAFEAATNELGTPVFDLILLGMGPDGHTASLFPGTGAQDVVGQRVIAVRPLGAAHDRITLSLPVLLAARNIAFVVTGANKRPMLARALTGIDSDIPASLIRPSHGQLSWFLDNAAAPQS